LRPLAKGEDCSKSLIAKDWERARHSPDCRIRLSLPGHVQRSTQRGMRERVRLAYIVANLVVIAKDEDDLTRRAIERFRRAQES
jgi:hypothetical protein